jgi:hypothetical protein
MCWTRFTFFMFLLLTSAGRFKVSQDIMLPVDPGAVVGWGTCHNVVQLAPSRVGYHQLVVALPRARGTSQVEGIRSQELLEFSHVFGHYGPP